MNHFRIIIDVLWPLRSMYLCSSFGRLAREKRRILLPRLRYSEFRNSKLTIVFLDPKNPHLCIYTFPGSVHTKVCTGFAQVSHVIHAFASNLTLTSPGFNTEMSLCLGGTFP